MKRGRAWGLFALPLVLAGLCVGLFAARPVEIKTSLYDLVGSAADAFPASVRNKTATVVQLVVSAPDLPTARATATAFHADLTASSVASSFRAIRFQPDEQDFNDMLSTYVQDLPALMSSEDCLALDTPEGRARLARRHTKRIFCDPTPPFFPLADDPFGLAENAVRSLSASSFGWTSRDGLMTAEKDGASHILMLLDLKPEVCDDLDRLASVSDTLQSLIAAHTDIAAETRFAVCGVPIHTAITARQCKTEITVLSVVSVLFILALALFVFKSVKWIPCLAVSLLVAGLSGCLALQLAFRSVHLMTLVFGTTLLGLVVDYSFHWLLHAPSRRREVVRGLLISFATTEVSLVPLVLSSLPVLRQSAVFLGVGLAAALATVLFLYPTASGNDTAVRRRLSFPALRAPWIAFLLLALPAVGIRFGTTPQALYTPPPELARAERFLAELNGMADQENGFLVVDRAYLADRLARLTAEQGAVHAERLGLSSLKPPSIEPSAEPVALASVMRPSAPLPDGVSFCQPRQQLAEVLSDWTLETRDRLLMALGLMVLLLLVVYRRRAFRVLMPSLVALAVVAGILTFRHETINLFHLLAAFLLMGMSIDYTVFLFGGGRAALRPAFCSLATSLVGFGLLAIVSFPVVRAFGQTLGIGLPVAFVMALGLITPPEKRDVTEHGASPFGLEILWWVYCLLGLRTLHFFASATGVCVWLFSGAVRKASPRLAKTVHFTRSLADKLVVMAEGRRLPVVETDGSPDAAAFVADVQARRGVFVLSSHVGTVEVLSALGDCAPVFHAWMEFDRTGVFNRFYLRHAKRRRVVIHPISEFGPQTVFTAGDALDAGDCLLMAADRSFGRTRSETVNGRTYQLAEGAFRFARALEHPVYFVACVADAPCHYRAVIRRLTGSAAALATAYAAALDSLATAYPDQHFIWS